LTERWNNAENKKRCVCGGKFRETHFWETSRLYRLI